MAAGCAVRAPVLLGMFCRMQLALTLCSSSVATADQAVFVMHKTDECPDHEHCNTLHHLPNIYDWSLNQGPLHISSGPLYTR